MNKNEFKISEFRKFVDLKIIKIHNKPSSLSRGEVLDSVCQFIYKPNEYLGMKASLFNTRMRRIFNLSQKPITISVNYWFLLLFGFKQCSKCKSISAISEFHKDSSKLYGIRSACKYCNTQDVKTYYKYHQKERLDYSKTYKQNNREKYNTYENIRRARKYNAITPEYDKIEEENVRWLIKFLGQEFCMNLQLDHIISLSNGGKHDKSNWQILTSNDNSNKNNNDDFPVTPIVSNKQLLAFLERI